MFDRKRLARADGMTFKELALVLLQFQKTSNICWKKKEQGHRDGVESLQRTSIPPGKEPKRCLWQISMTKE